MCGGLSARGVSTPLVAGPLALGPTRAGVGGCILAGALPAHYPSKSLLALGAVTSVLPCVLPFGSSMWLSWGSLGPGEAGGLGGLVSSCYQAGHTQEINE